jgi:hypothetical protein
MDAGLSLLMRVPNVTRQGGNCVIEQCEKQSGDGAIDQSVESADYYISDASRIVKPRIHRARELDEADTVTRVRQIDETDKQDGAAPQQSGGDGRCFQRESHDLLPPQDLE